MQKHDHFYLEMIFLRLRVKFKIQGNIFLSHYFVLQQIPGKRKALTHNEKSYFPCTEELVNATTVVKLNTNVK